MATHYTVGFERDGQFHFLTRSSYPKASARVIYQTLLCAGSMAGYAMYLKPAPSAWMVDLEIKEKFMRDCRAKGAN